MRDRLLDAMLWTVVFVAVAVAIAAGTRLVAWVVDGGDTSGIWKASLAIVAAAGGGGLAAATIRSRNGE
jgi:hypothetical protein